MLLLVVSLTVLAAAVVALAVRRRRRRPVPVGTRWARATTRPRPGVGVWPVASTTRGTHADLPSDDGLDAVFDAVLAEHAHELGDLLHTRLRGLVARGVPLRAIRPAPGTRTARVCFADGTVVLARSTGGCELADLVVGMQTGSVVLAGFVREGAGTRLALRGRTGRPLALLAIGLDQPD